jgi:caprin-1
MNFRFLFPFHLQVKLEGYREDARRGKELNEDQRVAVSKWDDVNQNLDFARELSGQFKSLVGEEEKAKKKAAKKDATDRAKAEVKKLAAVLQARYRESFKCGVFFKYSNA